MSRQYSWDELDAQASALMSVIEDTEPTPDNMNLLINLEVILTDLTEKRDRL